MIENLINEERGRLNNIVKEALEKQQELENKISEISNEIDNLNNQKNNITLLPLPDKKQYSLLSRVFQNKYKKEDNIVRIENRKKRDEISNIESQITSMQSEINNIKNEIEELNIKELQDNANIDISVEYLLNNNPELANNVEFMRDAINISHAYIVYDKTNDKQVYIDELEQIKKLFDPSYFNQDEESNKKLYNDYIKPIDSLINEINTPSSVTDGKYHIPINHLFEAIKIATKAIYTDEGLTIDQKKSRFLNTIINDIFKKYLNLNGKFSIEYGNKMNELWNNPDTLICLHGTGRNTSNSGNIDFEKINSIMERGLKASDTDLKDNKNNPGLEWTTYVQDYDEINFLDLLDYSKYNSPICIVCQIPKEGYGKDATIPIWGIADDAEERVGNTFLKPEYIIGYVDRSVDPENFKFTERKSEGKKYKYSLMDSSYQIEGEVISNEVNNQKTL